MVDRPVVILGFGAAGMSAVVALREAGYAGRVLVIDKGEGLPYSPVLTSYYAAGRILREACFLWDEEELARYDVDVISGVEVTSLDVASNRVVLSDGRSFAYEKCLIATGASPALSVSDEFKRCNPLVLRDMHDADRLRKLLDDNPKPRVLVSGTSMVALKVCEACVQRGAPVTMLGRSPHILRGSAHPACAARFEQWLSELGVTLRLSDSIESVNAAGAAFDVRFKADGQVERFDALLVAHGVRPNIAFVAEGALAVDAGILVDDTMRTSAADVYAAGDVAQARDVMTGNSRVFGLWATACEQGMAAGCAMAAAMRDSNGLPDDQHRYYGGFACNTIHVCDIMFASAGDVSVREGVEITTEEHEDGTLLVFAYQPASCETRELVGFNIVTRADERGLFNPALDEIGKLKNAIEKTGANRG